MMIIRLGLCDRPDEWSRCGDLVVAVYFAYLIAQDRQMPSV
jgi:hypothetical protein